MAEQTFEQQFDAMLDKRADGVTGLPVLDEGMVDETVSLPAAQYTDSSLSTFSRFVVVPMKTLFARIEAQVQRVTDAITTLTGLKEQVDQAVEDARDAASAANNAASAANQGEQQRQEAEQQRAQTEQQRQEAEQQRVQAERTRQDSWTSWFDGVKAEWTLLSDWIGNTKSSWESWFGASDSAGVRKTWSDWFNGKKAEWSNWAHNVTSQWDTIKTDAETATELATDAATEAETQADRAKGYADHPNIVGPNGYWMTWSETAEDPETGKAGAYVETDDYALGGATYPKFEIDPLTGDVTVDTDVSDEGRFEITDDGDLVLNY